MGVCVCELDGEHVFFNSSRTGFDAQVRYPERDVIASKLHERQCAMSHITISFVSR